MSAKWLQLTAVIFVCIFIPMKQICDPSCNSDYCYLQNDYSSCYSCNPIQRSNIELKADTPMIQCLNIIEGAISCQNFTYENVSNASIQNRTLLNVTGFDPEGWKSVGKCISLEECSSPSLILPTEGIYDHYISPLEMRMPHCINQIPFIPVLYNQKQINVFFGIPVTFSAYRKRSNLCTGLLYTYDQKYLLGVPVENLFCVLLNPENMLIFIKDNTLSFKQPADPESPFANEVNYDMTFNSEALIMSSDASLTQQAKYKTFIKAKVTTIKQYTYVYLNVTRNVTLGKQELFVQAYQESDIFRNKLNYSLVLLDIDKFSNTQNSTIDEYTWKVATVLQSQHPFPSDLSNPTIFNLSSLANYTEFLDMNLTYLFVAQGRDKYSRITGLNMTILQINRAQDPNIPLNNGTSNNTNNTSNCTSGGLCTFQDSCLCKKYVGICFPENYLNITEPISEKDTYALFLSKSPKCKRAIGPYCFRRYNEALKAQTLSGWTECDLFFNQREYSQAAEGPYIPQNQLSLSWTDYSTPRNLILGVNFTTEVILGRSIFCTDYFKFIPTYATYPDISFDKKMCIVKKPEPVVNSLNGEASDNAPKNISLVFDPSIRKIEFSSIQLLNGTLADSIFQIPNKQTPTLKLKSIPNLELVIPNNDPTKESVAKCSFIKGFLVGYSNSLYSNVTWYAKNIKDESFAYKINKFLSTFTNISSFSLDRAYTSSLDKLELHASYSKIDSKEILDASKNISFISDQKPIVTGKISNRWITIVNKSVDVYISFSVIKDCTSNTSNSTDSVTKFIVKVKSISGTVSNDEKELASYYLNSILQSGKITLDPSQLKNGTNYTISITPIDVTGNNLTNEVFEINVGYPLPSPTIKIIGPSVISTEMLPLNITSVILPPDFVNQNQNYLSFQWNCDGLNLSAPNETLIIPKIDENSTNKKYSCSVSLFKDNSLVASDKIEFLITDGNSNLFPVAMPKIEVTPKQIKINIPSGNFSNARMNFSWILAEVSNDSMTYGNLSAVISKFTEYYNRKYYGFVNNNNFRILESTNSSDDGSTFSPEIPKELNILNKAIKLPFSLIIEKDSSFLGYSYDFLYVASDSIGKMQMVTVKLPLGNKELAPAKLIMTNNIYYQNDNITVQVSNPGLDDSSSGDIQYSIHRVNCPLQPNSRPDTLIYPTQPFSEITLSNAYVGKSQCNYTVRLILIQTLGGLITNDTQDIQVLPKDYNSGSTSNKPTNKTFNLDMTGINQTLDQVSQKLESLTDVREKMRVISDTIKDMVTSLSNFQTNSTQANKTQVNQIVKNVRKLMSKILSSIKEKSGRKLLEGVSNDILQQLDESINTGLSALNEMVNQLSGSIDNTNKMDLSRQLKYLGTNISSINNVDLISSIPSSLDSLLNPFKNDTSDIMPPIPLNNTDFQEMQDTISELLKIYAQTIPTGKPVNISDLQNLDISIIKDALSSFPTEDLNITFFKDLLNSGKPPFEINIPNLKDIIEKSINDSEISEDETPIANCIMTLLNDSNVSAPPRKFDEANLVSDIESIFLEGKGDLKSINEQITKDFSDPEAMKKYIQSSKLKIELPISKMSSGTEVTTSNKVGLCNLEGKTFNFSIPDTEKAGIKIPVFQKNSTSEISTKGFKVVKYDEGTKQLKVQWKVPKCSSNKSRMLEEDTSSNSITVFSYSNSLFAPDLDIGFKFRILWIAIGIFGAGLILFLIQLLINRMNFNEYMIKACSTEKRLNQLYNKQAQKGCMEDLRNARLLNILAHEPNSNQISPSGSTLYPQDNFNESMYPMPGMDLNSSPATNKGSNIVVDPLMLENDKKTQIAAISLCDIERETLSSSCFFYFIEENVFLGMFAFKNLRYPGYLKTTHLVGSLISIIALSGYGLGYLNYNYYISGVYAALANLVLSYISKKLLVGYTINSKMSLEEAQGALCCNKCLGFMGILFNLLRAGGGIAGIFIMSVCLSNFFLMVNIPFWTYAFLIGFGAELIVLDFFRTVLELLVLKMSTYGATNTSPNCLGHFLTF